jgi:hypothetical protein
MSAPELRAEARRRGWLATHWASLACAVIGLGSAVAAIIGQAARGAFFGLPPLWQTAPALGIAAVLAVVALGRREPGRRLWIAGLAGAGVAFLGGWVAAIVAAAVVVWLVSELAG